MEPKLFPTIGLGESLTQLNGCGQSLYVPAIDRLLGTDV